MPADLPRQDRTNDLVVRYSNETDSFSEVQGSREAETVWGLIERLSAAIQHIEKKYHLDLKRGLGVADGDLREEHVQVQEEHIVADLEVQDLLTFREDLSEGHVRQHLVNAMWCYRYNGEKMKSQADWDDFYRNGVRGEEPNLSKAERALIDALTRAASTARGRNTFAHNVRAKRAELLEALLVLDKEHKWGGLTALVEGVERNLSALIDDLN